MLEIEIAEIDVEGVTAAALRVLTAAATHGFRNSAVDKHLIPIHDFCRLAGLPIASERDMSLLLSDAQKALGIIETVNLADPEKFDSPYGSWQLLSEVEVQGKCVRFEVSPRTFDIRIRNQLQALTSKIHGDSYRNTKAYDEH